MPSRIVTRTSPDRSHSGHSRQSRVQTIGVYRPPVKKPYVVSAAVALAEAGQADLAGPAKRACEQIAFNAEPAEAAEKKCLGISPRALRALRSNVVFFSQALKLDTTYNQRLPNLSLFP